MCGGGDGGGAGRDVGSTANTVLRLRSLLHLNQCKDELGNSDDDFFPSDFIKLRG